MNAFPEKFIFGIGDADLQVIGERHTIEHEGSCPTMWTHCAETSGLVYGNHTPLEGVDRYHRWREDVELLVQLGIKNYRTSVSMARVLNRDGSVNRKAIDWYRSYFQALAERGIKIYVTLYHWELPQYLNEIGGWTNRRTIEVLEKHARVVARELGDLIEEYFIINEHLCIAFFGYEIALHPPFERDIRRALQAAHHLLVAQGVCFEALRAERPDAKISTVYFASPVYADSTSAADRRAQKLTIGLYGDWLMDPLFTGSYPGDMKRVLSEYLPQVVPGDMERMKVGADLHSLGLNYYSGSLVKGGTGNVTQSERIQKQFQVKTGLGWPVYVPPIYPPGLYDMLMRTYARYELFGLKRIYISENGTAWPQERSPDGKIHDEFRISYVREHLKQAADAIKAGVPVEGYFLWTLLDNYEWQEGYRAESAFGIVHVDRETMVRTPKQSFYWYKEIVSGVSHARLS